MALPALPKRKILLGIASAILLGLLVLVAISLNFRMDQGNEFSPSISNQKEAFIGLKYVGSSVYSNGWYDYSFRIPENSPVSLIGHASRPFDEIQEHYVYVWRQTEEGTGRPTCTVNVYVKGSEPFTPIKPDLTFTGVKKMNVNSISWEKYHPLPLPHVESGIYQTNWRTRNGIFGYVVTSDIQFGDWCENILPEFRFGVDKDIPWAVEGRAAKEAAMSYIDNETCLKSEAYNSGRFIQSPDDAVNAFDPPKRASVFFSYGGSSGYPATRVVMGKNESGWVAVDETDPFDETKRPSYKDSPLFRDCRPKIMRGLE